MCARVMNSDTGTALSSYQSHYYHTFSKEYFKNINLRVHDF